MASDAHISLLKYNNYANRTTHPGDTFSDIMGAYDALTQRYANEIARIDNPTLWNPNDGVTTVITTPLHMDFSTEPDYLLVWHSTNNTIESRWFVIETVRLQSGQYTCTLKRDVISEAWTELTSATCNIYRAIANKYDSIIYNNEPVDVNQILESEMEIKDKTGCPWIVFYADDTPANGTVLPSVDDYDETFTGSKQEFEDLWSGYYIGPIDVKPAIAYRIGPEGDRYTLDLNPMGSSMIPATPSHATTLSWSVPVVDPQVTDPALAQQYSRTTAQQAVVDYYEAAQRQPGDPALHTYNDWLTFVRKYEGKRVYCTSDNQVYLASHYSGGAGHMVYIFGSNDSAFTTLLNLAKESYIKNCTNIYNEIFWWENRSVTYTAACSTWIMRLTPIQDTTVNYALPTTVRTQDSPYNVWCLPYGDIEVRYETTADDPDTPEDEQVTTNITCNKELNLRTVTSILRNNTTSKVYDAQILPYCPLPETYMQVDEDTGKPYIFVPYDSKLTNQNTLKDGSNNVYGYIFTVPFSSFERQITLDTPITVDDPKLLSMTKAWRLFAPNYGSQFEFSVARNNGLTGFNVSCTYLPIQPYIRVAPIWGGLYGDQFFKRDPRGLICGGDYSLPRTQDAWVNYLENNKNYQDIFNRQLQSMDVQRGVQVQQEQWGMVAGVLQGVTSGAIAGSAAGPWGALAGGIVGGVGAGITGNMDIKNSEKLFQENRSYATDMHALQLGNVKAMPNTLARTTAFNVDNRYFPIFATYTCTDIEERAVAQFIINRSMTIGRIGQPAGYINNDWTWDDGAHNRHARGFIQGSIMWINTKHDTHFVDALNDEFSRGIYTR